jgi:hypothetical protein
VNASAGIVVMKLPSKDLQDISLSSQYALNISNNIHGYSFTNYKQKLQLRKVGERIGWNHRDGVLIKVPARNQSVHIMLSASLIHTKQTESEAVSDW